jgi:Mn2+/Fe2+ NRAMP family transporter
MLADGDAGCLITAAQSGAQWGYRLILPSLLLIPVLYMVQEMTVRLGIHTGRGHGALIRERFGRGWAMVSAGPMILSAVGTLVVEFVGVAGVGELFGISRFVTVPVATVFLITLAFTRGYRRVERIGIAVGLAELAFIPAMLIAHPSVRAVAAQIVSQPLGHRSYLLLLAANAGAVIMPWMIFYQQGAVVDKGLSARDVRRERQDTLAGAMLTQGIMISVMVLMAATVGRTEPGASLTSVGQIAGALQRFIGHNQAAVLVGAGILGGALVSALVVSVAGAWGLCEVFGWQHSLNERPGRRTAKFYLSYALAHIAGALLVLFSADLISLAVDVEILNALLLPAVLGFLLALEARALPREHRMRGAHRIAVTSLCGILMALGLYVVIPVIGSL